MRNAAGTLRNRYGPQVEVTLRYHRLLSIIRKKATYSQTEQAVSFGFTKDAMYFGPILNRLHCCPANFFLIAAALLCVRASSAQEATPECSANDVDISYRFLSTTNSEKVVVTVKNISQRACSLRPGAGLSFGDVRHGHSIWTTSCVNCDAAGRPQSKQPVAVAVGETAYSVATWETTPSGNTACQEGGSFNSYVNGDPKHGYSVWAGSLLGDVCSVVRVDSYTPGTFHPLGGLEDEDILGQSRVTVKLTPSGELFYKDDSFWLDADISDEDGALVLDAHSCPTAFLKLRASDGTTGLQDAGGQCDVKGIGDGRGRSIRSRIRTMGRGPFGAETRVEVLVLVSDPHAPEARMISSNAIMLHQVDPARIEREWGPQVSGLAVSLLLDKKEYSLGEGIPLRLAVENFSAVGDIWSGELPCFAGLTFEVHDSAGHTVGSPHTPICMGHGWTQSYPEGKLVPVLGIMLSDQGELPNRAGDYTVTAIWQPFSNGRPQKGVALATPAVPCAVVLSSPVSFRVIDPRQ